KAFADFIAAVRKDFDQPDLPFYLVQLSRFIREGDPQYWNAVQDAQRRIPERVPNTAVAAGIDLELDDGIHVGTHGLKRLGRRLAHIAQHELFGHPGGTTPTFDKVAKGPGNTLLVRFKGVNMASLDGGMMGVAGGGLRQVAVSGGNGSYNYGLKPERHIGGFS